MSHKEAFNSRVGNRLDFHNQSSVWPNQSMIDCIIGSWDAILKISAHGRWDEGVILAITPFGIYSRSKFSDTVLYRRHCDICVKNVINLYTVLINNR